MVSGDAVRKGSLSNHATWKIKTGVGLWVGLVTCIGNADAAIVHKQASAIVYWYGSEPRATNLAFDLSFPRHNVAISIVCCAKHLCIDGLDARAPTMSFENQRHATVERGLEPCTTNLASRVRVHRWLVPSSFPLDASDPLVPPRNSVAWTSPTSLPQLSRIRHRTHRYLFLRDIDGWGSLFDIFRRFASIPWGTGLSRPPPVLHVAHLHVVMATARAAGSARVHAAAAAVRELQNAHTGSGGSWGAEGGEARADDARRMERRGFDHVATDGPARLLRTSHEWEGVGTTPKTAVVRFLDETGRNRTFRGKECGATWTPSSESECLD